MNGFADYRGDCGGGLVQFPKTYPAEPQDRLIGATAVVEGRLLLAQDRLIVRSGLVPLAG